MAWEVYTFDVPTGRLLAPIDIPSLLWTLTVSSCSLSTTREKGLGEGDASGLTVPWTALSAESQDGRVSQLAPYRRGIVLGWDGAPVVAGMVGMRTDSALDTRFDLVSPLDFLASRYVVHEETFGAGEGSTTHDNINFSGMSLRGIAAEIGVLATEDKPGGHLPILWQYTGEGGSHERTYHGYNVSNNSAKKLITEIADVDGGPDMQLRPRILPDNRLEWVFLAGSDAEPYLTQADGIPTITWYRGGGTCDDIKVAHGAPTMRVYATGSGQDEGTLCHLSEDMRLCHTRDPWPLVEGTASSTDWDNADLVARHGDARLSAGGSPIAQVTCSVHASDAACPVTPGVVWPGQLVDLFVEGHPALPDGIYTMRLMEMSGRLSDEVKLTFDPIPDPWEAL